MNIDRRVCRLHLGALLLLSGCATSYQPQPGFEPTYPQASAPAPQTNGAIYQHGHARSWFEDRRAHRIGDVITILLNEEISADNETETNTSKTNEIDIDSPKLFGYTLPSGNSKFTLDQELQSDQQFAGKGSSKQSNTVSGTITVTVAGVLANGNLLIRGQKWLSLNQGNEYVQISGIVRPDDVSDDNTVLSTQIADARIVYQGRGPVASAAKLGWLARFFLAPIWPY